MKQNAEPRVEATTWFSPSSFGGRFTRKQFWEYSLLGGFLWALFLIVPACVFLSDCDVLFMQVIGGIILLLWVLYGISVSVKRLHDIGVSGALMLPVIAVGFFLTVPTIENVFEFNSYDVALSCIGLLWMLFLGIKDSQKGTNKYGSSIKYPDAA